MECRSAKLASFRKSRNIQPDPFHSPLITPDKNYKVEFFAGYVAAPRDDAWEIGFTEAEFEVWLQNAADRSCFTSEIAPIASDRILTLSTCSYEFDDARFVLVGALR